MNLKLINELSAEEAHETFSKCCGCERWARELVEARPYASEDELYSQSERSFDNLTREDWLEAFAAHPKIGDIETLQKRYSARGSGQKMNSRVYMELQSRSLEV